MRGEHARPVMLVLGILFGFALIGLALVPTFALALVAIFFMGVGLTGFQLTNNALLMMAADREYFGRVMSLVMLAWGGQGLTALPIGILADSIGERWVLAIQGAVVIAVIVALGFAFATVGPDAPMGASTPAEEREAEGAVAGGS